MIAYPEKTEWYYLGRISVKKRIDHVWCIPLFSNEWYDHSWFLMNQTIGHVGCSSMKQKENFGHRCLSMTQTTVHDGSSSKNQMNLILDEFLRNKTLIIMNIFQKTEKKSTSMVDYQQNTQLIRIRKLPSKPSEWYDFAWLSMKQATDHNERSPKETHAGYKNGCLLMKQTTDNIDCLSMKPMNW